ncbi:hypothetical protein NDU88_001145 [Pleurodeles waltl]|uniref:Uncharacterized protein n=1 Tax=Pleurodeles waltl TaxID=8319 RepID=A0AAV7KS45_PLEWA|nr:hypothetical protein NDU88_001145 [Pleurodeles waltl]
MQAALRSPPPARHGSRAPAGERARAPGARSARRRRVQASLPPSAGAEGPCGPGAAPRALRLAATEGPRALTQHLSESAPLPASDGRAHPLLKSTSAPRGYSH